jgi:hypothetical protein
MKKYSVVRKDREYTVKIMSDEHAITYDQKVNPATGKGWQKTCNDKVFSGTLASVKAMRHWMYSSMGRS